MNYLENEIIRLRALEPEDLEFLYAWENDSQIWLTTNNKTPVSRFQLKEYIAQNSFNIYELGYLKMMIELKENNQPIGTLDLFDFDSFNNRVQMGIFIDNKFQNKGYAKHSISLIENYIFDFLKLNQVYALVAENNLISQKLFQKYEKQGVLKEWLKIQNGYEDVFIYQKRKEL